MPGGEERIPLVLVVDDFEDNREMFAEFLSMNGFRVAEAADGRQAVDMTFELLPDIVLMDLTLPVLDGWAANRLLKADARTQAIPVIALTGHSGASLAEEVKAAGYAGLLTKPCLPDHLVSEIRRILVLFADGAPTGNT